MDTSVSPLPIPLWPMLALSLALFGVTAVAATASAHHVSQPYIDSEQMRPEIAEPVSAHK